MAAIRRIALGEWALAWRHTRDSVDTVLDDLLGGHAHAKGTSE